LARITPPPVHSILQRPTDLVDAQDLGFLRTHLAYQSRGVARSNLELVVYPGRVYEPVATKLTYSRRGKAISFRIFPALLSPTFGGVMVVLAPQSRGRTISLLKPPAVVESSRTVAVALTVSLSRIRPVTTQYRLLPPAVVTPLVVYPPISVTLTKIRPVETRWQLGAPEALQPCYGIVCGEDSSPVVCGDDSSAVVTGSDQAGAKVSGADDGAKVTGATAPGGTVTGGDERREGC